MSNAGQAVLSVVGAAVGFVVGGPTGAAWGYQIGSAAGSALFPTDLGTISGPRLNDLSVQTSTIGAPIPIVYGTYAIAGNLLWSSGIIEKVTKKKQGGKGGPTQTTKTYSYSVNCAVGVCEGEITGIGRIWADAKLLCDGRPQLPEESLAAFNARLIQYTAFLATIEIYTGTETQLADPTIESFEGAGNVSAFRGLAYVVFTDFQLADYGNRVPSFRFEVSALGAGLSACQTLTVVSGPTVPEWDLGGSYDPRLGGYSYEYNLSYRAIPSFNNVLTGGWTTDLGAVLAAHSSAAGGTPFVDDIRGFTTTNQMTSTTAYRATIFPCDATLNDSSLLNKMTLDMRVPSLAGITHYCMNPGEVITDYIDIGVPPLHLEQPPGTTGDNPGIWQVVPNAEPNEIGGVATGGIAFTFGPDHKVLFLPDNVVKIRRSLQTPLPLCFGGTPSDIPGYCLVDGMYVQDDANWVYSAAAYRGIKIYEITGTFPNTFITQRPIGPFISEGDPRWTDQTYWEGVYNAAVAAGDAPAGWTYEVEYPREGSGHYVVTYDLCTADFAPEGSGIRLSTIVRDVCRRCNIPAEQVDASDLTEFVDGYVLTRVMSGRAAIEPLRSYGYFDCVESAGVLRWPTRGKTAVATLTAAELCAHLTDEARPAAVSTTRAQEIDLPRRLRVHYAQTDYNYEAGEQSASRLTGGTVDVRDVELPIAMGAAKAAQIAEVLLYESWTARNRHQIALGIEHVALEPADAVTCPVDERQQRLRITAVDYSNPGLLHMEAVRDDDGSYVSYAIGSPSAQNVNAGGGSSVAIVGESDVELMDLPLLRDADNDAGYYAAVQALGSTTFGGAELFRSPDGGTTYESIAAMPLEATMGTVLSALPAGSTSVIDESNTLFVELDSGELESIAEVSLLAGLNAAAIGADNRWEIIQFRDALLTGSPPQYALTGLVRGRRGTEWAVGTSVGGDRFVLLDSAVIRVPLNVAGIGATRFHKAVLVGTSLATTAAVSFTPEGVALRPFSVVNIEATRDAGDIVLTWVRRGRIGQELPGGTDIPLSEETEAYEIDIMDGVTVVRTISAGSQTTPYTSADQTTDFGSPQASLTVRIYQLSASVGRGYAAEATV